MARHLLMHLWPVQDACWRASLDDLMIRWHLFTGRKIIGVVTSDSPRKTVPIELVRSYLPPDTKLFFLPNSADLREVQTWDRLWDSLPETGSDHVFYCQGKGVTHHPSSMVHPWTSLMFSSLLDYLPIIEQLLKQYPIVGSFKKLGYGFGPDFGTWHYSGSFFWTNLQEFQARRRSKPMHTIWHGVESWPGDAFYQHEAGCVFHEGRVAKMELYEPRYWDEVVYDAWGRFLQNMQ